ncbi:phosphatase PAP2 family protein [Curvibacter delicatus]|jgi:undecaprenyl-diphosphatase|uniref:phosphatase PAP2 family protein n=1 Tax=Curvibacter delicatus TaxID=80879 RepID=UPI00082A7E6F|nr:phosphatase PAP2 family protein [Curvibacter delicatus]
MDLQAWDTALLLWINRTWAHPLLDQLMPWVTYLGSAYAVVVAILLVGWRLRRRRATWRAVVVAWLCLALVYGVVAGAYNGFKYEVQRLRPFVALGAELRVAAEQVQTIRPDSSFPSGHAANAFMLATLLTALLRPRRWLLWFGLATLVALSRVYLGLHYPGDVLAGAVLGAGLSGVLLRLHWLARRLRMADTGV